MPPWFDRICCSTVRKTSVGETTQNYAMKDMNRGVGLEKTFSMDLFLGPEQSAHVSVLGEATPSERLQEYLYISSV